MKSVLFLTFFNFLFFAPTHFVWAETTPIIKGDLQIPENYLEKKKIIQERDQIIPAKASQATSPGSFSSYILQYHLADIIEHNKFAPIKGIKDFEKAVNSNTQIDSSIISIKSKIDINRLKAELDIDSLVHTRIWTENSFKTLRAQMKLFEMNNSFVSIENKSNKEDTRTYLNLEKTW